MLNSSKILFFGVTVFFAFANYSCSDEPYVTVEYSPVNYSLGEMPYDNLSEYNFFQGEIDYTNVKNSLLISKKNSITAKNISDIFLIENNGKILIKSNHKARKFDKPWGFYEILSETQGQKIKKLTIFGGECTSLQKHKFRSEHWIITQGVAKVTVEEDTFELSQNSSIFIPKGTKHRIENHNQENLCLLEIQTGVYLEEDDIIRFDDKYAR